MYEIKLHTSCAGASRWSTIAKISIEGKIAILSSKSYFIVIDYCPWCSIKLIE